MFNSVEYQLIRADKSRWNANVAFFKRRISDFLHDSFQIAYMHNERIKALFEVLELNI